MPKGYTAEREVTCRACREPFRTTKLGRAAQLCHRPECDAAREAARRRALVEAAEVRQRQRDHEATLRAHRRTVERERARQARAAELERQRMEREAKREQQRREAKTAKLLAELHELGWRPPVVTSERVVVETPTIGGGPVAEALRALPRAVIARHASEDVGKGSVRRAIAAVAHAAGAHATADACRALAVEVLAWEFRLRLSAREVDAGSGARTPGSESTRPETVARRKRRAVLEEAA